MEPVRCTTCNAVLHFQRYEELCKHATPKDALDKMRATRFCCRRMYVTHPTELEELLRGFPLHSFRHDNIVVSLSSEIVRCVSTN